MFRSLKRKASLPQRILFPLGNQWFCVWKWTTRHVSPLPILGSWRPSWLSPALAKPGLQALRWEGRIECSPPPHFSMEGPASLPAGSYQVTIATSNSRVPQQTMAPGTEVWGESRSSGLVRWPRIKPQMLEGKKRNRNGCLGGLRNWQRS
jgi:hypothetical protein